MILIETTTLLAFDKKADFKKTLLKLFRNFYYD